MKRVQDCSKSRNGALIDPWEEDVEDDSMAIERDEEEDIEPTDGEWVYVCNQRPHTHDVRTLVCGNVYRKPIRNKKGIEINHGFMECLLSGGVDTQISW